MNKKKPKKKKSTIFSFNLKKVNLFQAWSHYQFLPVSRKVHQFRSYDQGTFLEPFQQPVAAEGRQVVGCELSVVGLSVVHA